MKISITLPSLRLDLLARTLDNIHSTRREHELEVLVDDAVRNGNVAGHAAAFKVATGDFVTAFVDDHTYVDGWDVLAVENFLRREPIVGPFCLGLRQLPVDRIEQVGTVFGIYYPYFPFMRRETACILGWYDTRYRRSFADCDLGLRVWEAGGRCEWSDVPLIVTQPEDSTYSAGPPLEDDMQTFIARWGPTAGVGWDLSHLRGFNIDYHVTNFGQERTCFINAHFG